MCGIVGLLWDDPQAPARPERVRAMADRIVHRGPDAYGEHVAGPVGLGHRRLSIIDVAGGDQPIFNEDRSIAVVFNGEIYNHHVLRDWLEGHGHRFETRTDTEVLVHAYEEMGPDFVEKLRGMFAFALWDSRQHRLMLARDRIGKKPLYYYHRDGRLLFGSELKALLADPGVDKTLDLEAISDYLSFLCIIGEKSPFRHVRKVPAAHYLLAERGRLTLRPYWRLDPNETLGIGDGRGWRAVRENLLGQLGDAVRCRLESEVPLGAFLSGGVDSSSVVALMARDNATPVQTASIGFDVAEFDESDYAAQVAGRYHTRHHVEQVQAGAAAEEELRKLVWHLDEPFADPSAIPTGRVSGIARQVVTVALSGDGGDEVLAGYRRHRVDMLQQRLRSVLPRPLRRVALQRLSRIWPHHASLPRPLRLKSVLGELALDQPEAHFHSISYFREPEKYDFFTSEALERLGPYSSFGVLDAHYQSIERCDPLTGMLYVDLKTYLPDRMLMKVDKMSMMHSLEVRSPFLDHPFVELCFRLPARYKLRGTQGKWLLKKAMEPYLPKEILYRAKQGFDVPLAAWLRGPLRDRLDDAIDSLGQRGYLAKAPMRRLFDGHQSGRYDFADQLWILYMLELWHRVFRVET